MPIIKEDNNRSSQKNSILFLISLIIISVGILFLIIGYGIHSPSTKNIYLDNGLITIPKIGHIDLIKTAIINFLFCNNVITIYLFSKYLLVENIQRIMLEKYRKRTIKKSFRISNQNSIKVENSIKVHNCKN